MTIPSQFIIHRFVRGSDSKFCAFIQSFTEVSQTGERVSFNILPMETKEEYYIKIRQEYWGSLRMNKVLPTTCIRYTTTSPEPIEYKNSIWYEGDIIRIHGRDIPVFNMDQACQILPGIFCRLLDEKYENYKITVLNSKPQTPLTMNAEIESYLSTHPDTECPITLNPLTKENMCLTPCGHGIHRVSMLEWLETKTNCPVCRGNCTSENLIVYSEK